MHTFWESQLLRPAKLTNVAPRYRLSRSKALISLAAKSMLKNNADKTLQTLMQRHIPLLNII